MARRRTRKKARRWWRYWWLALAAVPGVYLLAALIGSLVPLNRGWTESQQGIPVYLASNGIHVDIVMPVKAAGLDWSNLLDKRDVARPPAEPGWIAFGTGERAVYLETPRWRDLKASVAVRALTRGERIMHVEWVDDPRYARRAIRLRPEEYRRLWSAIRSSFRDSRPTLIPERRYGPRDAFYEGSGRASAFDTCNNWAASRLRIAGVETSAWSPFAQGLLWRYRKREDLPRS